MQASRILELLVATCYKGRPVQALGGVGVCGGAVDSWVISYRLVIAMSCHVISNGITYWNETIHFNSNKSPTRCNNFSSLLSWRLFTAQHVSGVLTPIIRGSTTAVAASGFIFGVWWWQCCWSWSGRPARPRPTALPSPHSEGKTRGCYCSCWAPDDGREDARNMLSCK